MVAAYGANNRMSRHTAHVIDKAMDTSRPKRSRALGAAICVHKFSTFRQSFAWPGNLVNGDEKWALHVNRTRRRQWIRRGKSWRPTPKQEFHNQKAVLSVGGAARESLTGSCF